MIQILNTTPAGVVFASLNHMQTLRTWLTGSYRGSNRTSLWLRKHIERLPVRQLLGLNLAGVAFFAAVVVPQANDIASSIEVAIETPETVVEVVPTEAKFQWPFSRFTLTTRFSLVHPGIDMIAPFGTAISPIAKGTVAWINSFPWGYGNHMFIEHENGASSLYAHLSKMFVKQGDTVDRGTTIGEVGTTGWATGSHLHLEIYQDSVPVNPLEVLPELE